MLGCPCEHALYSSFSLLSWKMIEIERDRPFQLAPDTRSPSSQVHGPPYLSFSFTSRSDVGSNTYPSQVRCVWNPRDRTMAPVNFGLRLSPSPRSVAKSDASSATSFTKSCRPLLASREI